MKDPNELAKETVEYDKNFTEALRILLEKAKGSNLEKVLVTKVDNLKYYGLEEGKIISYVDRTTPTRGRELTVLQQLFGNLGRLGAGNLPGN